MLAIYTVTAALFLVDSPCVDALLDIFCLGRRKIFYIFIFQEICSFTELTAIVYRSSVPGWHKNGQICHRRPSSTTILAPYFSTQI